MNAQNVQLTEWLICRPVDNDGFVTLRTVRRVVTVFRFVDTRQRCVFAASESYLTRRHVSYAR